MERIENEDAAQKLDMECGSDDGYGGAECGVFEYEV